MCARVLARKSNMHNIPECYGTESQIYMNSSMLGKYYSFALSTIFNCLAACNCHDLDHLLRMNEQIFEGSSGLINVVLSLARNRDQP